MFLSYNGLLTHAGVKCNSPCSNLTTTSVHMDVHKYLYLLPEISRCDSSALSDSSGLQARVGHDCFGSSRSCCVVLSSSFTCITDVSGSIGTWLEFCFSGGNASAWLVCASTNKMEIQRDMYR